VKAGPLAIGHQRWSDRAIEFIQTNGAINTSVSPLDQQVLRTDVTGMPLEWIGYQDAVKLIVLGQVSYTLGSVIYALQGGHNAKTGHRTRIGVNAIMATHGAHPNAHKFYDCYTPPLSNRALFKRDANLCLYCGTTFMTRDLSRDHVKPLAQGGADTWENVVTACKRCNNHKGSKTPEQAKMQLIAIPFAPTHAEYVYLQGRRILADQMEFLLAHFPRNSQLRKRLTQQNPDWA
jgi:hypothetical protein